MGLTGCISAARLRLMRVETAYADVTYRRTAHLDETLDCFAATNKHYRYSVAWIDCLASGRRWGDRCSCLPMTHHARLCPSRCGTRLLCCRARSRNRCRFIAPQPF